MKKRLLAVVLVAVMLLASAFALVGCGKDNGDQGLTLEKDQVVNVYSWWDPTNAGLTALKSGFEEKYKDYNVTLEFVRIPSSYYQTMITKLAAAKLAGGSAEKIDVMMLAFDQLPFFAQNGQVLDLTEMISADHLKDVYPAVKKSLNYNDKLYAVPRDVTSWCTYLNTKLFTDNGIELPSKDWKTEDFISLCAKFREKGVFGFGTNDYTDVLSPWTYLFGGQYFDETANVSTLSGKAKDGILTLYHLMENDGAMTIAEAKAGGGKVQNAFGRNEVAMFFGGLSDSVTLEGLGAEYTVLPLPQGVNGHQSHTFTNCWTIPSCTTQTAWATKVLEFFSGVEGQKIAAENDMGLPANTTVDLKEWIAAKPIRQYFVDAMGYKNTVPYQTHLNGSAWGTASRPLLRDGIFNVSGLTDAQITEKLKEMDNSLTYYLMGGK